MTVKIKKDRIPGLNFRSPCRMIILMVFLLLGRTGDSQVEAGFVTGLDFYQRHSNPPNGVGHDGAGSALLNFMFGPKIWVGGHGAGISIESQVNLGLFSLSLGDYKGLGAISLPVMLKFNFGGLSGAHRALAPGYSLGGGLQWSRTEFFYVKDSYQENGGTRKLYRVFIIEAAAGYGGFGMDGALYCRFGFDPDNLGSVMHIGLVFNMASSFNRTKELAEAKQK